MTEMDPWVRLFLDADTHAERAEVLVSAPLSVLMRYREALSRICERTGFSPGADYLVAIRTMLLRRRHRGFVPCMEFEGANTVLLGFIEQGRGGDD